MNRTQLGLLTAGSLDLPEARATWQAILLAAADLLTLALTTALQRDGRGEA